MNFRHLPITATAMALALLASSTAIAQDTDNQTIATSIDRDWISLNGQVKSITGNGFVLDYGDDQITIEMDDYDTYKEATLIPGDRVTVTGRIDNDLFEHRTVEANSVYVDRLNTFFYASAADEEDAPPVAYPLSGYPADEEWVSMTGTVVSAADDRVTLDTGPRNIKVDTSGIDSKPAVDPGDRISVFGEMDDADLFEGRELLASSMVLLAEN